MTMLEVEELRAGYGSLRVLHGVSLAVQEGHVAVLLGANGAGKTTLLRAITGMVSTSGVVRFEGRDIVGLRSEKIARRGIGHVPQGRGTFRSMTVEDNLRTGGYLLPRREVKAEVERWYEVFPRLRERSWQPAGALSGGEQQMLAIARALISRPKLLLLDEPSLGLAPVVTLAVFERLKHINETTRTTMLIVEQNAHLALSIADTATVIEAGRSVFSGSAAAARSDGSVRRAYLGQ